MEKLLSFVVLLCALSFASSKPLQNQPSTQTKEEAGQKFAFERRGGENGTDEISPPIAGLQLIPNDFLCQFCITIIEKLKERQAQEADFEKNFRVECFKANKTDVNVCNLINGYIENSQLNQSTCNFSVNLKRLNDESASQICQTQKLCAATNEDGNPADDSADHSSYNQANAKAFDEIGQENSVPAQAQNSENQHVNLTLNVYEI